MTRRRRAFVWIAGSLAGLLLLAGLAGLLVVRSAWFYDQVRQRMVSTLEDATGGRVEIRQFAFDWTRMHAEVRGLKLHGREPADKPPLLEAVSAAVGLKILSVWKRDIDIQYLEVDSPRIYLIVAADGSTNIPEPKLKRRSKEDPVETVLKLAVGRFDVHHGDVEVEKRASIPFEVHGRELDAHLDYDRSGPRYRGEVAVQPLELRWNKSPQTAVDIHTRFTVEKNRIGVEQVRLATGKSTVEAQGTLQDFADPHASFDYTARVALADLARFLNIRGLEGQTLVRGQGKWSGTAGYQATGKLHGTELAYRTSGVRLEGFRMEGDVAADDAAIHLRTVRISGSVGGLFKRAPLLVAGGIAEITAKGDDIDLRSMAIAAAGGMFRGGGRIHDFERFQAKGEIQDIAARRIMVLESEQALPWDALASGQVSAQGSFARHGQILASGTLTIAPAPESAPVTGHLSANYDSLAETVDVGDSSIHLPSSQAEMVGVIGRQMRVHFETRDLNDILPVLGETPTSLPLKLEGGSASFDGMVTGPLDDLHLQGKAAATRISYQGELVDSLQATVTASSANVKAENITAARGTLRVQGEMAVALADWKTSPGSLIYGKGSVRNADLADLAKVAGKRDVPATGTLDATGEITGTLENLQANGDLTLLKAVVQEEPVDRFTGHVRYRANRIELTGGQMVAGPKQVQVAGTFDHAAGGWNTGRLTFQVTTNTMPVNQIHALAEARPGIKGTVALAARGSVDVAPPKGAEQGWRVRDLHLDFSGKGLELTDQPLGDVHLTANSQGDVLRAHLDSGVAGSAITGDGEWKLEGEYPGTATINFGKVDFAGIREWLAPKEQSGAFTIRGSAEGTLRIEGPALQPQLLKTELRIPKIEVLPAAGMVPQKAAVSLGLHNSGDIVVTMVNRVVTVQNVHMVGQSTDLMLSGKVDLQHKSGLDLRVKGRLDLAMVRDLDPGFQASGAVTTDATIRGTLDSPDVNGRTEFQNAAFNIVDVPNGISKANGVITFAGERATIQSFTGETGGGRIDLSGFASYADGQLLFRLAARAREVRIRYPEGVSTVANANLSLTGTSERSTLAGTVIIQRTGFNPQSDFSSLIAQSSEPVETPAARTGLLGGLSFDIQVSTATDLQFQSSLAQDLQVDANLQLRGTYSNPAVLGRINITRGQIVFFGTKYAVNQGSVAFYNPLRIDPIVDVSLATKARGVDVTLNVTGPLHHLSLTPSSDPPLSFNEIVALLATGRTPTSDPALLEQQSNTPQSWQQMGASALLGQAIASPVAGRLQRFFGVSSLRIDPTIAGVENNPQARLTLEQQITKDITFTYITNVTTSNPQVVQVEWSFSKTWSAVAVRDENGMFGMDFYYKKRFK